MRDLFLGQRRFYRCREHGQDFSATPADRKVAFAPLNFIPLQRLFVVRRDQLGIGAFPGVAVRELVQGFAHTPRERFFPAAIA